jgi:hypothetical protein
VSTSAVENECEGRQPRQAAPFVGRASLGRPATRVAVRAQSLASVVGDVMWLGSAVGPIRKRDASCIRFPLLSLLLALLEVAILIVWVWAIIWAFIDNFRRTDHSGWAKAGWTILILLLPVLGGSCMWRPARQRRPSQREHRPSGQPIDIGCSARESSRWLELYRQRTFLRCGPRTVCVDPIDGNASRTISPRRTRSMRSDVAAVPGATAVVAGHHRRRQSYPPEGPSAPVLVGRRR